MTVRVVPAGAPDVVASFLFSEGAASVQEDAGALITSFPEGTRLDDFRIGILELDPGADVTLGEPAEFSGSLHGTVASRVVGSLIVAPTWDAWRHLPERTIVIEPAGAFGTGEHPTTRGMLRLMQGAVGAGDVVADLGAGSAVLSIAAARLGAARVAAIELDGDAIANAEENVVANGVQHIVSVIHGDAATLLRLLSPVNVVLANIVSGVVLELLPVIRGSLAARGVAILSGILAEERPRMIEAFRAGGWSLEKEDCEEEWWSALIAPR